MNLLASSHTHLFVGSGARIVAMPLTTCGLPRAIARRLRREQTRAARGDDEHAPADCDLSELECESAAVPDDGAAGAAGAEPPTNGDENLYPRREEVDESGIRVLHIPSTHARDDADSDDDDHTPPDDPERDTITTMRVVSCGAHTALAATTMSGVVALFDVDHLDEAPIVRHARRSRWQDNSAWSVAASPPHDDTGTSTIVVGTNAHRAFLFDLVGADEAPSQMRDEEPANDESASPAPSPASTASAAAATAGVAAPAPAVPSASSSYVSAGHNVPSVDVSPCGRFLALSCIDGIVRIARLARSDQCDSVPHASPATSSAAFSVGGVAPRSSIVSQRRIDNEWGWSVRWVPLRSVRTWSVTLASVESHESHAPASSELTALRPAASSRAAARADALVEHMVEQLTMQLEQAGAPVDELRRHALRMHLRAQLAAARREEGAEEDEEEDDEDEEFEEDPDDFPDDEDDDGMADALEDEEHDAHDEDQSDEDLPPALRDEDEEADQHSDFEDSTDESNEEANQMDPHSDAHVERASASVNESPDAGDMQAFDEASQALDAAFPSPPPLAPFSSAHATSSSQRAAAHARVAKPADLLLYSSKSTIYLLDQRLKVLCSVRHVCVPTLTMHRSLDRLAFVEYIPALSVVLLASSASDRVLIYRIARYACGRYRFEVQAAFPKEPCRVPIKGLSVCRVATGRESRADRSLRQTLERQRLTRTHTRTSEDGSPIVLADADVSPAPPSSFESVSPTSSAAVLERRLARFRVHILFADEAIAAYELAHRHDGSVDVHAVEGTEDA